MVFGDSMGDFWVQAGDGADNCDAGVGIEDIEDTTGGDLDR